MTTTCKFGINHLHGDLSAMKGFKGAVSPSQWTPASTRKCKPQWSPCPVLQGQLGALPTSGCRSRQVQRGGHSVLLAVLVWRRSRDSRWLSSSGSKWKNPTERNRCQWCRRFKTKATSESRFELHVLWLKH